MISARNEFTSFLKGRPEGGIETFLQKTRKRERKEIKRSQKRRS